MLNLFRFKNRRIAFVQGDRIVAVVQNRTYHVDEICLGLDAEPGLRIVRAELLPKGVPCEVGQRVPQTKPATTRPASAGGVSHVSNDQ